MLKKTFLATTLLSTTVLAGPPLLTNDPDTPGNGKFEINIAVTAERAAKNWGFESPLVDFNYGLGDRVQLTLELPWTVGDAHGDKRRSGLGNLGGGAKIRFLDEDKHGFSLSVFPQFSGNLSRRSARLGLADAGWEAFLPVQVSKSFGKTTLFSEFGYLWYRDGANSLFWGVAVEREISEKLSLLAEVSGESLTRFREHTVVFNVGTHWQFSEHTALIASAGRGIRDAGEEVKFLGYAGLQFTF